MKKILDFKEYQDLVSHYNCPGCCFNDYIQNEAEDLIVRDSLYVDYYKNNVFLFVNKPAGMRVYYYINDFNETADFSQYKDLVIEILFRRECPEDQVAYFTGCGFQENLIRDQYTATYKSLNVTHLNKEIVIEPASTMESVEQACKLFNDSFDKLSGGFISPKEYSSLLETRCILIAKDPSKLHFSGALHEEKNGSVNIIGHIAVTPQTRGKGVGKALVADFIRRNMESEKTRYQLWVQRQNKVAVSMYQNLGFKFANKSTISLIK